MTASLATDATDVGAGFGGSGQATGADPTARVDTWVVRLEFGPSGAGRPFSAAEAQALIDCLGGWHASCQWHPDRYAMQLRIPARDAHEALEWALAWHGEATRAAGSPPAVLVRVEVLIADEPDRLGSRPSLDPQQEDEAGLAMVNAERRRIVADLHDGVVQDLVAADLAIAGAVRRLDRTDRPPVDLLRRAGASTRKAIEALRTLFVQIYPPDLDQGGLGPALRDLVGALQALGIDGSVSLDEELRLPAPVTAVIFRTAQEALRNVTAHSYAKRVTVTLTTDADAVVLEVTDDGIGFAPPTHPGSALERHIGLRLLAERATAAGGRFTIDSRPGTGTRLRLAVPR